RMLARTVDHPVLVSQFHDSGPNDCMNKNRSLIRPQSSLDRAPIRRLVVVQRSVSNEKLSPLSLALKNRPSTGSDCIASRLRLSQPTLGATHDASISLLLGSVETPGGGSPPGLPAHGTSGVAKTRPHTISAAAIRPSYVAGMRTLTHGRIGGPS